MWAVHSLSCERCKDGQNPIDALPLLFERIEDDEVCAYAEWLLRWSLMVGPIGARFLYSKRFSDGRQIGRSAYTLLLD